MGGKGRCMVAWPPTPRCPISTGPQRHARCKIVCSRWHGLALEPQGPCSVVFLWGLETNATQQPLLPLISSHCRLADHVTQQQPCPHSNLDLPQSPFWLWALFKARGRSSPSLRAIEVWPPEPEAHPLMCFLSHRRRCRRQALVLHFPGDIPTQPRPLELETIVDVASP